VHLRTQLENPNQLKRRFTHRTIESPNGRSV
jgi:hypothetical protein